jgi:hypothetical protein
MSNGKDNAMNGIYVVQVGFQYESGSQTWLFSSLEAADAKLNEIRSANGFVGRQRWDYAVLRGPVQDGGSPESAPELEDLEF